MLSEGENLKTLLQLQDLDLKVEQLVGREREIPKQKSKYNIRKERLAAELEESQQRVKRLLLEQRECEGEIELKQLDIRKKDGQLLQVKKNEEYQALLHEIDLMKKQISIKEERILTLMEESEEAKARLVEDKKRIALELEKIEAECAAIDAELEETVRARNALEAQLEPLATQIMPQLLSRYRRIRTAKKEGAAVVPLRNDSCSGCNMAVTAQVINEILGGEKTHTCKHCGRLLYAVEL